MKIFIQKNFIEVLRLRSSTQLDRDAFTFSLDGETEQTTLIYQELDRRSRRMSYSITSIGFAWEKCLITRHSGILNWS